MSIEKLRQRYPKEFGEQGDFPHEITHGVIAPITLSRGFFEIQAHTASGKRQFCALEKSADSDLQSKADIDQLSRHIAANWKSTRIEYSKAGRSSRKSIAFRSKKRTATEATLNTSPRALLALLRNQNLSLAERRRSILAAEIASFDASDVQEISKLLREFVLEHRFSDSPETLVAVGSAIRKFMIYINTTEINAADELLEVGPRGPLPLEVELVVFRTICEKLRANPPLQDDLAPELSERIWDVIDAYARPRILSRDKFGAVTLNATLSLAILRSRRLPAALEAIEKAEQRWFSSLIHRRARVVASEFASILSDELYQKCSRGLQMVSGNASKAT